MMVLLQIVYRVYQWKNFESPSISGKDMDRRLVLFLDALCEFINSSNYKLHHAAILFSAACCK